jgi:hypothetical protein
MIDEDYVEALEKQTENLVHHLQMLTLNDTESDIVIGMRKMDADRAIKQYFEFKRDNSND